MKKKLLLSAVGLIIGYCSLTAQTIDGSLWTGTFVQGISPVVNTITVDAVATTTTTIFYATDDTYTTEYDSYTDNDGSDGFAWDADMGQLPPGAVIWAKFYDVSNTFLDYSADLFLDILATPQWLVNGSVNNVVVNGDIISFEGNYPIYNYPYTIPSSVKGIGGRSLDIAGNLIFVADFDMSNSSATVSSTKAEVQLNLLDQLPTFTNDINFSTNCTLGNDLNLSFVVTEEISTETIELNMPKIKFPVSPLFTISVDAGISLYATLKGQLVIGQDQGGQFGFIDNGTDRTKVVGILTGKVFIRGKISVLGGVASATASLEGKARLGIGFDFVSVPSTSFNPLVGGDLDIWGKACLRTFLVSYCYDPPSFYYGQFGDTSVTSELNSFDPNFNTQSFTVKAGGTLVLPDFAPQPTFATRADNLYAVWLEHDNDNGYLLFSKLNSTGTEFSSEKIVANNGNSMSNPKVGILPSGSAIITWSQSRYDINTIPTNATEDDKAQAQDVWFAIYDNSLDSIVYSNRLGDDFSNLQSGRPEGEAKVAIGDDNDAMITWVSKDVSQNSTDIWFTHLTETADTWDMTTPAKLVDLSGTNFNVGVVYTDNSKALAVWINDPDGDEDTYDSDLMFAEWDGSIWSNAQLLSNNDGSTKLKELSLAANDGFIALAWTSTHFENDNDFQNIIEMEVYDAVTGEWDNSSYFEDVDSLYYFQSPIASISNTGLASICYQVVNMFSDTAFIDNGELYLYAKDLYGSSDWTEITNNSFLCDTNTFIWDLTAGFSGSNNYYTMTQEYNDDGVVTNPYNGVLFGDPNLSMVLRGIQINSNMTVSDIAEPGNLPAGIKEVQNRPNFRMMNSYPNPFNEITTIEFQLQQGSNVVLEIYDFTGTRVSQLLSTNLSAGIHKTVFKAGDLPSGMYFSKLTVDGVTTTGKLVLIK